ncbi:unnamed protein product [Cuscuta campestris]|uniref:VASt domain-containing protein n=1 Tax=Cuscuta campestris TaxID=132261 RepID=A0A484LHH9_9ASTE|nr:unnamed protein product [Cuscuta campestris]
MTAVVSQNAAEASPSPSPAQLMDHRSPSLSVLSGRSDIADSPDRASADRSSSLPSSSRASDPQSLQYLKSEEYRKLFHLPADEVLIQDFNCALHENILIQGHMYLFAHNICFYSNIFGFETKKIIRFDEITSVRKAKMAAILPAAIEVIVGEKKFFFTSLMSRDEAFKLINDGWLRHNGGAKANGDQQEPFLEPRTPENLCLVADKPESSDQPMDEELSVDRDIETSLSEKTKPVDNGDYEIVPIPLGPPDTSEEHAEIVQSTTNCSSSEKSLFLEEVDCDAPEVPKGYTMVAESKFPVNVEKFFDLFFSDDGVGFQESFHTKCGDKDFKCTQWVPCEQLGRTRNLSFQHPIKIYLGAKFGSCHELQKYQLYRNSHLVVETCQKVNDVPYGDYFQVEGLWDVTRDGSEGCILKVYTNVAFSKKTMWKGKILQSTLEECENVFGVWIELAHELLKQKKLEKEQANSNPSDQGDTEKQVGVDACKRKSNGATGTLISEKLPDLSNMNQQERCSGSASAPYLFRYFNSRFCSLLKSQSQLYVLLVVGIAVVLFLMQLSIIVLLSRPQQIHVISQGDCGVVHGMERRGTETLGFIENQVNHLKEEMVMVETMLDKMQSQYGLLKAKLTELEQIRKHHRK